MKSASSGFSFLSYRHAHWQSNISLILLNVVPRASCGSADDRVDVDGPAQWRRRVGSSDHHDARRRQLPIQHCRHSSGSLGLHVRDIEGGSRQLSGRRAIPVPRESAHLWVGVGGIAGWS